MDVFKLKKIVDDTIGTQHCADLTVVVSTVSVRLKVEFTTVVGSFVSAHRYPLHASDIEYHFIKALKHNYTGWAKGTLA